MLKHALEIMLEQIIMSLSEELWERLRDAPDATEGKARIRSLLKQRGNEEIHNAIVRATR